MSDKPFHNPFGVLGTLRGTSPPEPDAAADVQSGARTSPDSPRRSRSIPRAVVRLERSGRGGKAVTVVEHLTLAPPERESWLQALKTALGCGGSLEGEALVLQGDQRQRLPSLLSGRGVKKVTMG